MSVNKSKKQTLPIPQECSTQNTDVRQRFLHIWYFYTLHKEMMMGI